MNREIRELIRRRAERIGAFAGDFLTYEDPADFERGQAFRWAVLVTKGPRAFLHAFKEGELHLDDTAIESVYWSVRGEIPGPHGLMSEERIIIRDHNGAVDDYLKRSHRSAPVIAISERRTIGLLR